MLKIQATTYLTKDLGVGYIRNSQKFISIKNLIRKWAKDMNRYFTEEDIQMANKLMKRYLTLLAIRKMQIKIIMRSHYTHLSE